VRGGASMSRIDPQAEPCLRSGFPAPRRADADGSGTRPIHPLPSRPKDRRSTRSEVSRGDNAQRLHRISSGCAPPLPPIVRHQFLRPARFPERSARCKAWHVGLDVQPRRGIDRVQALYISSRREAIDDGGRCRWRERRRNPCGSPKVSTASCVCSRGRDEQSYAACRRFRNRHCRARSRGRAASCAAILNGTPKKGGSIHPGLGAGQEAGPGVTNLSCPTYW
jgi:hypothetical protein